MEAFDDIAGWAELILVPVSLGLLAGAAGLGELRIPWPRRVPGRVALGLGIVLLLFFCLYSTVLGGLVALLIAVRLIARHATPRRAGFRLALPLVLVTALTVAQPFGVRATKDDASTGHGPHAAPRAHHSIEVLGVPAMRFVLYTEPIHHLGLGECCPPQDTLRVRSWLVPGILTNASDVTELNGDGAPTSWSLAGSDPNWRVDANYPSSQLADVAWRLEAGVVSGWGILFWVAAVAGIAAAVLRSARAHKPGV